MNLLIKVCPVAKAVKKLCTCVTQLEAHLSQGANRGNLTLEHILPYKPSEQWQESFGVDEYTSAIDRLGNMTLLTSKINSDLGQKPWLEKKAYFESNKSKLELHQQIASYAEWDIEAVRNYQQFLANKAIGIWKYKGWNKLMASDELDKVERPLLTQLQSLGWSYIEGATLSPDESDERNSFKDLLLERRLNASIKRINPWINAEIKFK